MGRGGAAGRLAKVTDLITKRLLVGSRTVDHTQAGLTNLTFLSFSKGQDIRNVVDHTCRSSSKAEPSSTKPVRFVPGLSELLQHYAALLFNPWTTLS